jgi:hypothetical protein
MAIHGAELKYAWTDFHQTFWSLNPELLQQPDRFAGRQAAAFLVRRANFHRGDDFAV